MVVLTLSFLGSPARSAVASPTLESDATVEKFTGGHTRVVWLTDADNRDSFAGTTRFD